MAYGIGVGIGMMMNGVGNGTISIKRKSSSNKRVTIGKDRNTVKKSLNYNPREISEQIVRAVKAESASFVLTRAKTKLSVLKRCIGTGQYDERELLAAVNHAQRMVNCARMKVKNLKEEEQQGHDHKREQMTEGRKKKNEIKQKVRQEKQEWESKIERERMHFIQKENTKRRERIRKQKMHRNEELSSIQEADMKYLKDRMGHSNVSEGDYSGVSLEFSSAALGLQEIQFREHAVEWMEKQLEQEMEIQVEMVSSSMSVGGISESASIDGAASAVTIDVSI